MNHIYYFENSKKFYKANSMKELFKNIALKNIINFLKTIGLLLKI